MYLYLLQWDFHSVTLTMLMSTVTLHCPAQRMSCNLILMKGLMLHAETLPASLITFKTDHLTPVALAFVNSIPLWFCSNQAIQN